MSRRSFRLLAVVAAMAAAAALTAADGAGPEPLRARLDDPAGVRAFWTADRLLAARPRPMPRVDLAVPPPDSWSASARRVERSFDWAPRRPAADAVPDFDSYLFDGRRAAGLRPPGASGSGHGSAPFVAANRGSFGLEFTSSRLVPPDARVVYPYSAVGKLFFSDRGSSFVCSGAVVSPRVVMTAGHCVFSDGRFHRDFLFIPAFHEGNAPFGSWTASDVLTTAEWMDDSEVPHPADFGALVLDDIDGERIGRVTGWLGFKTGRLAPNHVTILGFPGNLDRGQRMHATQSSDSVSDHPDLNSSEAVIYGSDMGPGASGGPWVQNFGNRARGQSRGRNKLVNRIVGHSSFASSDANLLVLGSSPLGSPYKDLFDAACDVDTANCQAKGKAKKPKKD